MSHEVAKALWSEQRSASRVNLRRRVALRLAEKIGVPLVILPLRLLIWSWRKEGPSENQWRNLLAPPRIIFATCHGMFFHCIAFSHLPARYGRPLLVMVSPSLGGTILGMILKRFGMSPIPGKPGRRGAASARRFIRQIESGYAGVLAVDGSRGPAFDVKPGVVLIARHAHADVLVTTTSAGPGISFPTWDRAHLPVPFSRVKFVLQRLDNVDLADMHASTGKIQQILTGTARRLRSPVLPRRLSSPNEEVS